MRYKILGQHEALQIGSGNGSNFGSATVVRVFNTDSQWRLVSVETSAAELVGDMHIAPNGSVEIEKDPSDELFIDAGAVFGTPVAINA